MTPARLIAAIVTECGVIRPVDEAHVRKCLGARAVGQNAASVR